LPLGSTLADWALSKPGIASFMADQSCDMKSSTFFFGSTEPKTGFGPHNGVSPSIFKSHKPFYCLD